jgi:hypothetical protein
MVKNVNTFDRRCEGSFDPPIISETANITFKLLLAFTLFSHPLLEELTKRRRPAKTLQGFAYLVRHCL